MSSEVPSLSFGDVVSAAGLAVGLVTGCLYTAGWMYAYVYFDRFRIPLLMLDIPLEHFLVYGGLVVRQNIALALASVGAVIAPLWAVARWSAWLGRFRDDYDRCADHHSGVFRCAQCGWRRRPG